MSTFRIRPVYDRDIPALLALYTPYVTDTTITFEYTVPTLEEFTERVHEISRFYPYLVAEWDNHIIGYAYASRQMERAAYQWNADLSIYLSASATGHGIGSALYQALFFILTEMGLRNLYAIITHPNPPSELFHQAHGFSPAGIWHQTGCKFGRWLDVGIMEKSLGNHCSYPEGPVPFSSLNPEWVGQILSAAKEGLH